MHTIFLYWQFIEGNWKLIESFPVDEGGYSLDVTKDADDHLNWMNNIVFRCGKEWLTKQEMSDKGIQSEFPDDPDYDPILGRAVIIWTLEEGIRLFKFHPLKWTSWLTSSFYEKLYKMPDWALMIQGGYDIYFKSTQEIHKHLNIK